MELYNTTDKKKYEVNIPSGTGEYYSTCPACSHNRKPINQKKRCFSWNRTKEVGYCYHCGSSFVEFKEREQLNTLTPKPLNNSTSQQINYINPKYLTLSIGLASNFGTFLKSIFDEEELKQILEDYQLGMTKDRSVIYWYIDKENRIRSGKIMQYDPLNGKRVKSEKLKVKSGVSWVHSILKKQGDINVDWKFTRCLFGEHLLTKYPDRNVFLVEGEKTAIICSIYFSDSIWLATGGSEMLSENVCHSLRGRKVLVIADSDKIVEWEGKIKDINQNLNLNLKPYEKFNMLLSKEQKEKGWDLADYFLNG